MTAKNETLPPEINYNLFKSKLIDKTWLTRTTVRLRIANRHIARHAQPGQFINIKVSDSLVPLLRRPFSIHRVDPAAAWFEILFQVVGRGTAILADFEINDELDILGPLGNHFEIPPDCNHAILVAGGLGIAPFLFLAQQLVIQDITTVLFYGNRSHSATCCLNDFDQLGVSCFLATDDGSAGFKGTVTELLASRKNLLQQPGTAVFACGPNPMLRQLKQLVDKFNFPCQVSLETMMACGFGVCLGCVVTVTDPRVRYKYVCKDGPVFHINEIELGE